MVVVLHLLEPGRRRHRRYEPLKSRTRAKSKNMMGKTIDFPAANAPVKPYAAIFPFIPEAFAVRLFSMSRVDFFQVGRKAAAASGIGPDGSVGTPTPPPRAVRFRTPTHARVRGGTRIGRARGRQGCTVNGIASSGASLAKPRSPSRRSSTRAGRNETSFSSAPDLTTTPQA